MTIGSLCGIAMKIFVNPFRGFKRGLYGMGLKTLFGHIGSSTGFAAYPGLRNELKSLHLGIQALTLMLCVKRNDASFTATNTENHHRWCQLGLRWGQHRATDHFLYSLFDLSRREEVEDASALLGIPICLRFSSVFVHINLPNLTSHDL